MVKDVDIVEAESAQALVQAGQKVLTRTVIAVGSGPHVPSRLAGDDHLVSQGTKVSAEQRAKIPFRTSVRWAVVVGQVEVGDPEIEGSSKDGALCLEGMVVAEIVPEPERQHREQDPAPPTSPVLH